MTPTRSCFSPVFLFALGSPAPQAARTTIRSGITASHSRRANLGNMRGAFLSVMVRLMFRSRFSGCGADRPYVDGDGGDESTPLITFCQ